MLDRPVICTVLRPIVSLDADRNGSRATQLGKAFRRWYVRCHVHPIPRHQNDEFHRGSPVTDRSLAHRRDVAADGEARDSRRHDDAA